MMEAWQLDARLNGPGGVAVDTFGNLYITDLQNNRVRKVTASTGIITTIAGTGTGTYDLDDVPATSASLWGPQDICVDKFGNLYIADGFNYRIRKITPAGVISTYAGDGIPGYSGEGVPSSSSIGFIVGICADTTGNIYISSNTVCRVIRINTMGFMSTVAGNGGTTYSGDGVPATDAQVVPGRIVVDKQNNFFIADRNHNRVYKVDATTDTLRNIAGNGTAGDSGDGGLATSASIYTPFGISIDECGNLYIPTVGSVSVLGSGRRIRKVTFNPPTTPTITISGITTATVGATVTVNAAVSGAGSSYTIRWFRNSSLFSTTTTPTTTFVKGSGTDIITARIVPTITYCYDSTTTEPHLVLEAPVAIGYVPQLQQYSVYPNPAQQQLSISSPAAIHTITISSPVGQQWLAYTGSGSTEVQLSVAHLPAGLYIVRVNNSYTTKMIKE